MDVQNCKNEYFWIENKNEDIASINPISIAFDNKTIPLAHLKSQILIRMENYPLYVPRKLLMQISNLIAFVDDRYNIGFDHYNVDCKHQKIKNHFITLQTKDINNDKREIKIPLSRFIIRRQVY